MIIQKKRIFNLEKYISSSLQNTTIIFGIPGEGIEDKAKAIGFDNFIEGNSLLPNIVGPITKYNCEGKFRIRKDLPKEKYVIELPWELRDWGGYLHTGVNYIERERYQKELILPLECYLTLSKVNGKDMILSNPIVYNEKNVYQILHTIKLFLECFGSCWIFNENQVLLYRSSA